MPAERYTHRQATMARTRVAAVCLIPLLAVMLAISTSCRAKVAPRKTPAAPTAQNTMHTFTLTWADLPSGPNDGEVRDPSLQQIDEILEALSRGNDGFAILAIGDEQYIQSSAGTPDGKREIVVEYRAGNANAHFQLDEPVEGAERLKQLFRAYFTDPKTINRQGSWKPLKF